MGLAWRGELGVDSGTRRAVIRTSDRNAFRACRRSWAWSSHLKGSLVSKGGSPVPLWFGSGFHFAMEDYHGNKEYAHPRDAWLAYYEATIATGEAPPTHAEHKLLGVGMLEYYADSWLTTRDPLKTFVWNGRPCTELNVEIPLPFDKEWLLECGYDEAVYALTFDRVVEDDLGLLWIVDYKTAKQISTQHYQVDPQCTAYIWAGAHIFDRPVMGMIYQQHLKTLPNEPTLLRGGKLSVSKQQKTTYTLYRKALIDLYGDVQAAPSANLQFMSELLTLEDERGDPFIRRDIITRNQACIKSEGVKIMAEASEMLNPNTPLYPNPTRDCSWRCSFMSPCISLDDGSNAEFELNATFEPTKAREDRWRMHLKPQSENA